VLFTTQSNLREGSEVELAISWPALLNNAAARSGSNQNAFAIASIDSMLATVPNPVIDII
jgi:hypothetical protein